jgi:hypothetical protein
VSPSITRLTTAFAPLPGEEVVGPAVDAGGGPLDVAVVLWQADTRGIATAMTAHVSTRVRDRSAIVRRVLPISEPTTHNDVRRLPRRHREPAVSHVGVSE